MNNSYALQNLTVVTPFQVLSKGTLIVTGAGISQLTDNHHKTAAFSVPTHDLYCYPALINVHDHLRGDYLPRIGPSPGSFYLNWSYWDNDLKASRVYTEERAKISVEDCYYLGAYKNLFSGVVTVHDHFPHEVNKDLIPKLPLRVIENYTLAHECSSFDLKWGDGIEVEHQRAREKNFPFITHLEEGFDQESQSGVETLLDLNCLDDHCVLVHCIGFSDKDINRVKAKNAHVVWCPASNLFMFNVTSKIRKIINSGINVCLGTDSTHTGSINLLEEMKLARGVYQEMYQEELSARKIVEMVTINPAKALRVANKIGSIEEGKLADLLLIKPRQEDPYEALAQAEMEDIELLIHEGKPIYGSNEYEKLFQYTHSDYSTIRLKKRVKLIKGDPYQLLKRIRKAVGFNKELEFMPIDSMD